VILNIGGRTGQTGIIAFDVETGDILWQATDHGPSYATPQPAVIDGRERLFVLTKSGLVMLDPSDGRVYFEIPYTSHIPDGYSAVTPVVSENLVLMSIFGQGTMCVQVHDDDTWSTVWEDRRTLTSQYNPFLEADGYVYGIHATDTSFRCVDLATGELQWRWKSELRRSTQLIAGDHILLLGEFGELGLIELNPAAPVECGITPESVFDGERCYAAPALADGRLYLRNEQELVCLDLRPRVDSD
jgi:outer membrane protein assembly factor BamB